MQATMQGTRQYSVMIEMDPRGDKTPAGAVDETDGRKDWHAPILNPQDLQTTGGPISGVTDNATFHS